MIPRRYLLPAILLLAAAVRVWGIGFGLPHIIARPDETEIAGPAVGFLSGDLRPPFFQWPTLFVYLVALLYVIYFAVSRPFGVYASLAAFAESRRQSVALFLYISRVLSAVFGVLTVWWVYAICRRAFDETVAAVAALFLALSCLDVRDSHFGTTDVAMTALVVLTVLAILRWQETGSLRHAALAGVAGGLAASTKYNGLGVGFPFMVAVVQRFVEDRKAREISYAAVRAASACLAFGFMLTVAFFGTSPYILIDWPRFVNDVTGVQSHLLEGHGVNLGQGWWYYARVVLPAAVGWPIFVTGIAGMIGLLTTELRRASVLFAFPISYYLIAGRGYTVFARYIIPVVPFLCIAAAWLAVTALRALARKADPVVRNALIAGVAIVVVAPTAYDTLMLDRLLSTTDNRVVVARALIDLNASGDVLYQSGEKYGHVPMKIDGHDVAHAGRFDEATGRFDTTDADWILVQRSPLLIYSAVPAALDELVRQRYELVRRFPVGDDRPGRTYDQQDAFYLPLHGFAGIARPGPGFDLYRKARRP